MFYRSDGPCHKKSTFYSRNIYRIYTRSICPSTNILKEVNALGPIDPLKVLKISTIFGKCVLLEILLKYLRFVVNRSFKIYSQKIHVWQSLGPSRNIFKTSKYRGQQVLLEIFFKKSMLLGPSKNILKNIHFYWSSP